MKRTTLIRKLQRLHKQATQSNDIRTWGLCRLMGKLFIGELFKSIFEPSKEETRKLKRANMPVNYWGYDISFGNDSYKTAEIAHGYTRRRQVLVLLMIELLKDDVYVKRHMKGIFED